MLKIPLPLFYVAADKNDELTIVDGLQRISAIKGYISENKFNLSGLEFLTEFNGKNFKGLPENMQIRIEETNLDFVIINPDSPPAVQRNIFKRLNTGGLPLTEQEIRHALYYGPVTDILKELAETIEFQNAVDHRVKDSRMAAQELVLRFLSFSIMGIDEYHRDEEMDSFLSNTMQIINDLKSHDLGNSGSLVKREIINKDIDGIREKFVLAMIRAYDLFRKSAFRISTPLMRGRVSRTPVNKSLFELWSILLSEMTERNFTILKEKKEQLYEALENEFSSNESNIRKFIGKDSTKVTGVKGRYEIIGKIIDTVIKEEMK
jgi:hypothetical protein